LPDNYQCFADSQNQSRTCIDAIERIVLTSHRIASLGFLETRIRESKVSVLLVAAVAAREF
jgi:hypothetical protein